MRTFRKFRLVAVILATLAVIVTPALLFAHAHLVRSTPAADATLTTAPASLFEMSDRLGDLRVIEKSGTGDIFWIRVLPFRPTIDSVHDFKIDLPIRVYNDVAQVDD